MKIIIPNEIIETKIFFVRGRKVIMDKDLAILYEVPTKQLNQAVKRNISRFPEDFMFQLNESEAGVLESGIDLVQANNLRSQFVTSSYGGRRYRPYVFTEQGIAMLSSVLKSERAIQVNIQIMRTFIKLREMLSSNKALRDRIEKIEKKYDNRFKIVFKMIKQLIDEEKSQQGIGFRLQ
ncbi:MAG: ORF6N domain-containing protein [Candidatus Gracilibacteria bacterium]|jgi:hypothetical protein